MLVKASFENLPPASIHHIKGDITHDNTAKSVVCETLRLYGRLDSIVLNAGTLDPVERVENATLSEWKECFDVNFFANVSLVQNFLLKI